MYKLDVIKISDSEYCYDANQNFSCDENERLHVCPALKGEALKQALLDEIVKYYLAMQIRVCVLTQINTGLF